MRLFRSIQRASLMIAVAASVPACLHSLAHAEALPLQRAAQPVAGIISDATSADPLIARSAIAQLRSMGPNGLDALFTANVQRIEAHEKQANDSQPVDSTPEWSRLSTALDAVAAQRDAFSADLYWYTDLEAAKAASRASGKPILSLRLLGHLDDDLSCANSRFFRTVLYANAAVSKQLREHFILHWKSERPVPKITIDFGDGRKIERTITGNSIHYVLDSDGRVIDAIPGLYGPAAFLQQLSWAAREHQELQLCRSDELRSVMFAKWHDSVERMRLMMYQQDLGKLQPAQADSQSQQSPAAPTTVQSRVAAVAGAPAAPPARIAARVAIGKLVVERPLLAVLRQGPVPEKNDEDPTWARLAELHAADAQLDEASTRLVALKHHAHTADAIPVDQLVRNFQRVLAIDTERDEYLLHLQIHHWLATDNSMRDMETLNTRVYAELFLTPRSDPWLGLAPADVYSALDDEGLVNTTSSNSASAK